MCILCLIVAFCAPFAPFSNLGPCASTFGPTSRFWAKKCPFSSTTQHFRSYRSEIARICGYTGTFVMRMCILCLIVAFLCTLLHLLCLFEVTSTNFNATPTSKFTGLPGLWHPTAIGEPPQTPIFSGSTQHFTFSHKCTFRSEPKIRTGLATRE